MKHYKMRKLLIAFFALILLIVNCVFSIYALQSDRELFEELDSTNTFIVAYVDEGYPAGYLDIAILNNNGETVKELRLLYFEMFKKWTTLPQGEYTIVGVNLVDEKNYPVETVKFTVDESGGSAKINVGSGVVNTSTETKVIPEANTTPDPTVATETNTSMEFNSNEYENSVSYEYTVDRDETNSKSKTSFIGIAAGVVVVGCIIAFFKKKK